MNAREAARVFTSPVARSSTVAPGLDAADFRDRISLRFSPDAPPGVASRIALKPSQFLFDFIVCGARLQQRATAGHREVCKGFPGRSRERADCGAARLAARGSRSCCPCELLHSPSTSSVACLMRPAERKAPQGHPTYRCDYDGSDAMRGAGQLARPIGRDFLVRAKPSDPQRRSLPLLPPDYGRQFR